MHFCSGKRCNFVPALTATVENAKDGPVGLEIVSLLVPVDVGQDEDGDAITSCVIEACDTPARKAAKREAKRLPKSAQTALRALDKAIAEVGEPAPTSNHIPASVRVVTIDQWRTYAYRMGVSTSDEARAKRKAFQSATDALNAAAAIGIWEPHVWRVG
jgi:hypothetical protein